MAKEAWGCSCHKQSLYNHLALRVAMVERQNDIIELLIIMPKAHLTSRPPAGGWNNKALGSLSHLDVGFLCRAVRSILSYLKAMLVLVWPVHTHTHTHPMYVYTQECAHNCKINFQKPNSFKINLKENGAATVEDSRAVSQKVKHRITIWSSNSTSGHIPKRIESRDSNIFVHQCL